MWIVVLNREWGYEWSRIEWQLEYDNSITEIRNKSTDIIERRKYMIQNRIEWCSIIK